MEDEVPMEEKIPPELPKNIIINRTSFPPEISGYSNCPPGYPHSIGS
jgi:hypothetical protein